VEEPKDPLVGRKIAGKFAIERMLGAGAMGVVYRARQVALEKTVAIKVLHRDLAADPEFAERFLREARAASRLDHPNSIRVFDFGEEPDGLLYIAMEYVEGRDLAHVISEHRGPLPPANIVDLLCQALAALAVAHDMGVLHRDLKPENIMVLRGKSDEGQAIEIVKVCDFGIAKITETVADEPEQRRAKHSTGLIIGTPAYMSPEQARGEKLDARSDLYSMGVVLYELVTGRVPFEATTPLGVALKHIGEQPVPPSQLGAGVDAALEAICLKAMSKSPGDRYQNAREMRQALRVGSDRTLIAPLGTQGGVSSGPLLAFADRASRGRRDSGKANLEGATPGPIRGGTSRVRRVGAWLAAFAIPVVCAAAFARLHRPAPPELRLADSTSPKASSAPVATEVLLPSAIPGPLNAAPVAAENLSDPARSSGDLRRPRTKPGTVSAPAMPVDPGPRAAAVTASAAVEIPVLPAVPAPQTPAPAQILPEVLSPAPPSPAPPPEPTYDLASARVDVGVAANVAGATASSVTRAVSEAGAQLTACYRAVLPRLSGATEGRAVLHVETDGAGVITDARLGGALAGSIGSCIASAVRGRRVANVDTGSASADVPLAFRPR